ALVPVVWGVFEGWGGPVLGFCCWGAPVFGWVLGVCNLVFVGGEAGRVGLRESGGSGSGYSVGGCEPSSRCSGRVGIPGWVCCFLAAGFVVGWGAPADSTVCVV